MSDFLKAIDLPLEVTAVEGEVAITGPDGVGLSLTPAAAAASARRLLEVVAELQPQGTYQKPLG
ncbi:MAG: hypothetical protein JWP35_3610 [Caulobacter sp.]|nr:hypothetical protein [Caulobacter sp.]